MSIWDIATSPASEVGRVVGREEKQDCGEERLLLYSQALLGIIVRGQLRHGGHKGKKGGESVHRFTHLILHHASTMALIMFCR